MQTCIYCLKSFDPRKTKAEHILLAGLGAEFKKRDIVCSQCNQELGSTIDKSLVEALVFVKNILELPTSRGEPPPIPRSEGAKTGRAIELAPGARPILKEPKVEVIELEPGKKQIKISGSPDFIKHVLQDWQKSGWKLVSKKVRHSYSREPIIIDAGGLGGHDHFRAVAKMALNFLATQDHQLVLQPTFNKIRDYIRYGVIEEGQFLCTLDYRDLYISVLPREAAPFYNRVAVFLSHREHNVIASIELFKHLRFLALLSDTYTGLRSVGYVIVNDPMKRTHRISTLEKFPHIATNELLHWPSYEAVAEYHYYKALPALLNDLMAFHYEQFPKRVIEEAIDKYLKKPGKTTITSEDIDKISEYIARQIVLSTMPIGQEAHFESDNIEELSR
jgi:hypothetical protein